MGVTVILLILGWFTKSRKFFWSLVPFFVLMFFATFYLQAHYAIDAIAGLFAGVLIYWLLIGIYQLLRPLK